MKLKQVLITFTLLFALFSLPVQAESIVTAGLPAIHVGDTWSYTHTNNPSNTTVFTVVEMRPDGGFKVKMVDSLKGERVREYDSGWNLLTTADGHPITPKQDMFHFPLQAGQPPYTGQTFSLPHPRKSEVTLTQTVAVKSVRAVNVTVKAGTFNALKIEMETQYKLTTGYANRTDETYWYVPSVGRWVKYSFLDWGRPSEPDEMELTGFKRGK